MIISLHFQIVNIHFKSNQTKSNQIKQFQKNRNEKKNRSRKLENEQKRH